ncbi:MAG: HAD-IA family hydrolase [Spirochaetaceae bacterium]|nr:HAD-IA family hydrolase [Spirochaetaceae bacterium]
MIRYLLLDLDNTLYSDTRGMERDILVRMNAFVADFLGMTVHEARERRHERVRGYGTTLEWLMAEEGLSDPEIYFAAIHPEGEEYCIEPDPDLAGLLDSIELPKAVFTNSPHEHAKRVLGKLGVTDKFQAIYDIRFSRLKGKPDPDAFRRVCAACGVSVEEALFVDDLPKYLRGFLDIGGNGLLLDEAGRHAETGMRRIHSLAELKDILAEESAAERQLDLFGGPSGGPSGPSGGPSGPAD